MQQLTFALLLFLSFSLSAKINPLSAFKQVRESSAQDVKLARHIHSTMRGLRRGNLDSKNTSAILLLSKKSDYFDTLIPLFSKLDVLSKTQTDRHKFADACNDIKGFSQSQNSKLESDFSSRALSFCRNLFLAHMIKAKQHKTFSKAQEAFIKGALPHYLRGEYKQKFNDFLKTIPKKTEAFQYISHQVSRTALDRQIMPNQDVLSFIDIDSKLTAFIQKKGLLFSENSNHFKNEYRTLINQLTTHIRAEELEEAASLLSQAYKFYQNNSDYLSQNFAWDSLILAGKRFIYQKNFDYSNQAFSYALEIASNSDMDESYFYSIWPYIIQKKYAPAAKIVQEYNLTSNIESRDSKLRYWVGKILQNTGQGKQAFDIYNRIAESEPMSFYGILSLKELSLDNPQKVTNNILHRMRSPSSGDLTKNLTPSPKFKKTLGRLSTWLDLDLNNYSYSEINDILSSSPSELFSNDQNSIDSSSLPNFLVHQLSHYFNSKEKYLHSFRLIYNALNRSDVKINGHLVNSLYPLHYLDKIKEINSEVDPLVVLSLIRQESAFNPRAKSVAGARGLMQLMPATARMMHGRMRTLRLYDADFNLKLGTKYFKRLEKKYDGDLIDTLCAYNAGEGNLKKWKENIFVFGEDAPLEKIEMIPFSETRKYVKLIYRNLFYYRLLTNDPMIGESLAETLRVSVN